MTLMWLREHIQQEEKLHCSSYLNITTDGFEVVTSTDGLLTVDDVDGEFATGTFNLTYGEDVMDGTFMIPFCTNLVH